MLIQLSIQNYALINHLVIDFTNGLSIITGETGAGKSILLGALGLIMGNRADLSSLKNTEKKCVIEAQFSVDDYDLQNLYKKLDIDYENETIIRREILPSGKSRAFVNDTPVNLSILTSLRAKLLDIHSQYQTMELSDTNFQFHIIDVLAKNQAKVASYKRGVRKYSLLQKELQTLLQLQEESKQQYEYNLHLFNELEESNLKVDEQEIIESKLSRLSNIEDIKINLSEALQKSINEEIGIQSMLFSLENNLQKISSFSKEYEDLSSRVTSIKIELDDIVTELEAANEQVEFNPIEIEEFNDRLQLIYNLQKKHVVTSIDELLVVHKSLAEKVAQVEGADDTINKKQQEIKVVEIKLNDLAETISKRRNKVLPKLQKELEFLLAELGMPNACFSFKVLLTNSYFSNGKDELEFLFSANKGGRFGALKKVASGGELSRIMLSIKKILSENSKLPTIIFDEIDTGVSGEVSNKIATIMKQMSVQMQVITITHLPQIAAKGNQHYKVFKEEVNGVAESNLKALSNNERIREIAEMLSGKDISKSALTHAKELLN